MIPYNRTTEGQPLHPLRTRAHRSLQSPEGWAILTTLVWGGAGIAARVVTQTSRPDPVLILLAVLFTVQGVVHGAAVLAGSYRGARWAAFVGCLFVSGQALFYLGYNPASIPIGLLFLPLAGMKAWACVWPTPERSRP